MTQKGSSDKASRSRLYSITRRFLESCVNAVRQAEGRQVVADFGPHNGERLLTFLEIACRAGRRLVIMDKDEYMLRAMSAVDPTIPTPRH